MTTGVNSLSSQISQTGTFKVAQEFKQAEKSQSGYQHDTVEVTYKPINKDDVDEIRIFGVPFKDASSYSEQALLLNETTSLPLAASIGMKTGMVLAGLGAAGAVGMTAVSLHGIVKAKDPVEKLDHATNLGWGVQSGAQLAATAEIVGAGVSTAANILGGVGGIVSTGVGIHKYISGVKQNNTEKKVMGALDIGIGAAWIAASLTPAVTLGTVVFIVLGVTKIGIASKGKLKHLMRKVFRQSDPKTEQLLNHTKQPVKSKPPVFNAAISHKF